MMRTRRRLDGPREWFVPHFRVNSWYRVYTPPRIRHVGILLVLYMHSNVIVNLSCCIITIITGLQYKIIHVRTVEHAQFRCRKSSKNSNTVLFFQAEDGIR
eukprot:COSAG03_NODE_16199_length_409_cov_0.477419_1_plen_100_part_10